MTGARGMLGHRVVQAAREAGHDAVAADVEEFDLTDPEATRAFVADARPEAVVNCAAYTRVDDAEQREALALAVNGDGAGNVAAAAARVGARVLHLSTDYVFDGTATAPYTEDAPVAPRTAYGRSKLAGERALAAAAPDHAIVRTAWLFGRGGPNFVDTMLRLAAERDEVAVVADQLGSPTWTGHLAPALVELAQPGRGTGVFHAAGGGSCSWYELAAEAFARAGVACRATRTTAAEFRRPAPRPAFSVLATARADGVRLPPWQDGLAGHLQEVLT